MRKGRLEERGMEKSMDRRTERTQNRKSRRLEEIKSEELRRKSDCTSENEGRRNKISREGD